MRGLLTIATAAAVAVLGGREPAIHAGSPAQEEPVFSAQSEVVVLQVMVEDWRHAYVTNLPVDAFTVREDGAPQPIAFFNQLDAPVDVGIIVDGSGSMQPVQRLVAAAADGFVRASNPDDELFALTFSDTVRPLLPERAPFTHSSATLRAALAHAATPRGRTALYDAIVDGLRYADTGMFERKALVVISDGGDNASMSTFDDVLDSVRLSNAVIDSIAIVDPAGTDGNPGRLHKLAEASGGEAFQVESIGELPQVLARIARDVRNMYTIGYAPSHAGGDGFRRIQVHVRAAGHHGLRVRTRDGYLAGKR